MKTQEAIRAKAEIIAATEVPAQSLYTQEQLTNCLVKLAEWMQSEETSRVVYIVQHVETKRIHGCFETQKDAIKYANGSENVAVISMPVESYSQSPQESSAGIDVLVEKLKEQLGNSYEDAKLLNKLINSPSAPKDSAEQEYQERMKKKEGLFKNINLETLFDKDEEAYSSKSSAPKDSAGDDAEAIINKYTPNQHGQFVKEQIVAMMQEYSARMLKLPEKKSMVSNESDDTFWSKSGFNECLREIRRLNNLK